MFTSAGKISRFAKQKTKNGVKTHIILVVFRLTRKTEKRSKNMVQRFTSRIRFSNNTRLLLLQLCFKNNTSLLFLQPMHIELAFT